MVLEVGEWKTTVSTYILIIKKVEKENGEPEEPTSVRQGNTLTFFMASLSVQFPDVFHDIRATWNSFLPSYSLPTPAATQPMPCKPKLITTCWHVGAQGEKNFGFQLLKRLASRKWFVTLKKTQRSQTHSRQVGRETAGMPHLT